MVIIKVLVRILMIKSVTYNNNNQTDNDTNDNVNYSSVCFHVIFLETIL